MLSKRYESTEVDRITWLHVPSGTHWFTSTDTHEVVEIQIETTAKRYVGCPESSRTLPIKRTTCLLSIIKH